MTYQRPIGVEYLCPVVGCTRKRSWDHLMCGRCWKATPKPLQDAVWRAIRNGGVFTGAYRAAKNDAIAFHARNGAFPR